MSRRGVVWRRSKTLEYKWIEEMIINVSPPFSCSPKQRSHFSSPHFIGHGDDDDDRDYFITRKKPKVRPKKKKITIELDDYDDVVKYDNDDEEYTPPHIPFKKRNRLAKQRLRTRYLRGKRRGKRRRKYLLRKKLIWDRKFGDPDDIVDDYIDESDDIDENENDDQMYLQTKDHNSMRLDGFYGIKDIPQHSLDRNYGTIFENSNAHTLSSKTNRRIPSEYLNERDDIMEFNQNPDVYMRSENINFDENSNRRSDSSVSDGYSGRQLKAPSISFDRDNKSTTNVSRRSDANIGRIEGRKFGKEKAVFDMPSRFRRVYSKWSKWSKCSAKCTTRRFK